jgi:pimeloyl-ACP methyl ester carboxylesterase
MRFREFSLVLIFAVVLPAILACEGCIVTAQTAVARPKRAQAWTVPNDVTIERKTITFVSQGARLTGTLYFASSARHRPAVVVLHGASSPSSNLPLYRHLEEMLPPLGINVFVFDRRGSGASEGGGQDSYNFDVLADDGTAASAALATDEHIDPKRIGYWGISQGGWLALLAASKDDKTAFAIAVSAPMTTPDVQMNFAVANILRINAYPDAVVEQAVNARKTVDSYLRGNTNRAVAQKALDSVRGQPWFRLIYMDDNLADPRDSSWLRQMQFDPMPILDRVEAPVLMVYGQADPWIPVGLSVERLGATAAKHRNVEIKVIDGADHTMMQGVDPKDQIDPKFFPSEAPNSPAYFALLGAWFAQHGFAEVKH